MQLIWVWTFVVLGSKEETIMSYKLIKGTFHIHYPDTPRNGPEPDGDTIKFKPDNRSLVEALPHPNRPAKFTQTGITTIRFEGIDALETHFGIGDQEFHQAFDLAIAARDTMLAQCGFGDIDYFDNLPFKVESVENHPIEGYILSNGLDTFGRVIAFVFIGEHSNMDGSQIFVTPDMLDKSINVHLLSAGHAYPAFYLSLPSDLRTHLANIITHTRNDRIGLWQEATATTSQTADIPNADALQDLAIWPKLFRRLAAFFQDGHTDLNVFDEWLRADPKDRDDRLILPNQELGNMHDLIAINNTQVGLNFAPETVVIVPDDFELPTPAPSPIHQHIGEGSLRIVGALVNPNTSSEQSEETVTILNTANQSIVLDLLYVADNHNQQALDGTLNAGETLRITLSNKVRLSNKRDTISIIDNQGTIIDQVSYEKRNVPEKGFTLVF